MQKADERQTKSRQKAPSDAWVFPSIWFGGLETAPMRTRQEIVSVGLHAVLVQELLSSFRRYISCAILFGLIAIAGCSHTSTSITLVDVDEGVVEQVVSDQMPTRISAKMLDSMLADVVEPKLTKSVFASNSSCSYKN